MSDLPTVPEMLDKLQALGSARQISDFLSTEGVLSLYQVTTPTVSEVIDKLQALGSARQIALHLATEGITGLVGIPNACPIACYVHRETGDERVSTTGDAVFASSDDETFYSFLDTTYTPVHRFVDAFDRGLYPDLVRRPSPTGEQFEDDE